MTERTCGSLIDTRGGFGRIIIKTNFGRWIIRTSFVMTCFIFVLLFAVTHANAAAVAAPVIVSPAGGEFYVAGSQQRVRLDPKTRAKSVLVELSVDGGTTFSALGSIDNT